MCTTALVLRPLLVFQRMKKIPGAAQHIYESNNTQNVKSNSKLQRDFSCDMIR